jgi:hypothetical protein
MTDSDNVVRFAARTGAQTRPDLVRTPEPTVPDSEICYDGDPLA